mgnify:CR=1 FL=1
MTTGTPYVRIARWILSLVGFACGTAVAYLGLDALFR